MHAQRKPRLYLETSVPSYLAARPSAVLATSTHQLATRTWWESHATYYDIFISRVVLQEIQVGDPHAAARRLAVVSACKLLEVNAECEALANDYLRELGLPEKARVDSLHVAIAVWHGLDYLLTWNCRHMANQAIIKRLTNINTQLGFDTPVICTPEALLYAG
jgi:hypothetical protein